MQELKKKKTKLLRCFADRNLFWLENSIGNRKRMLIFILLFLDEKKQKSTDRTEFAKNLAFKLKSFKWKAERFFTLKHAIFLTQIL